MKRLLWIILMLLSFVPTPAFADDDDGSPIDCGVYENKNQSYQYGENNWLEYNVETRRKVDLVCAVFSSVKVEAYVVGVSGSAASATDYFTAAVKRQVPVSNWGTYRTNGSHYRLWFGLQYNNGYTTSTADVQQQALDCSVYNGGGSYYTWDPIRGECVEVINWSPILVDVARDGYHLTSAGDGVLFDLDGDGVPEQVAWTKADSDDAWLAMDRNGNGKIDNGSELFGNRTPAFAPNITALNGFEALRVLEAGLPDHYIEATEAPLLLWTDRNHNGISETDELVSVGAAGLAAIGTEYREKRRVDQFKNEFRQQGTVVWADGVKAPVYDVWLRHE